MLGQIALLCGEMEGATACARRRRRAADECHYEMKLYVGRESWADVVWGCVWGTQSLGWALCWDREGAPGSARVGWLQTSGM